MRAGHTVVGASVITNKMRFLSSLKRIWQTHTPATEYPTKAVVKGRRQPMLLRRIGPLAGLLTVKDEDLRLSQIQVSRIRTNVANTNGTPNHGS